MPRAIENALLASDCSSVLVLLVHIPLTLTVTLMATRYNRGRPPVKWLREEDERLQSAIETHGEV
jgi:hypothetical protein